MLGTNFKEGLISKIQEALKDVNDLTGGKIDTGNITGGSSTGTTSSSSGGEVKVGDSVKVSSSSGNIVDVQGGSGVSKNGSWSDYSGKNLKTVGYDNGYFKVADDNGNIVGWATRDDIARFADGGRTGDLGSDGKFVIADSNEMIANANDTKKFDEMYNYIKNSGGLISQLSSQYGNLGNYTMPSLGTDLNSLTNGVTNNNSTNNTNNSPISMSVSIINEKGSETFTEQKLFKAMNKWQREQGRTFR